MWMKGYKKQPLYKPFVQNTLTTPTLRLSATISHDCWDVTLTDQSFNITRVCARGAHACVCVWGRGVVLL
jgi:hypothetical protein